MSLFGPSIPKGITKSELKSLRGRLMSGHGGESLSSRTVEHVMELVDMAMDSDNYAERSHHVEQASADEVDRIEKNLANNLSPSQKAYVHKVFAEYIAQNKSSSIF
mgnify:CR=1 FL=1